MDFDLSKVTIAPLCGLHDLSRFRCSRAPIQSFCRDKLLEAHDAYTLRAYVAVHDADPRIVGFYYLCLSTVAMEQADRRLEGDFLHLDALPTVYLGMLGVHRSLERRGIGRVLMTHALGRVQDIAKSAGTYAMTLDALDEDAAAYYESKFDFQRFEAGQLKMFLPVHTILQLEL